jgi:putative membrane protein
MLTARSWQDPADEVSAAPARRLTGEDASLARDHLANERTYLAWLRTAIGVMVLGLAVAKLVHAAGARADIAGGVLLAVGFLLLVYGTAHTRRMTAQIDARSFAVDDRGPLLVAGLVAAGVVVAAILLFI